MAIKFHVNRDVFQRELQLRANPAVRRLMRAMISAEGDVSVQPQTAAVYVLPPFVVMHRGETLNHLAQNADQGAGPAGLERVDGSKGVIINVRARNYPAEWRCWPSFEGPCLWSSTWNQLHTKHICFPSSLR